MVNVYNELIESDESAKDQLIHWKHDAGGIFNYFEDFYGVGQFIHKINCLWSWIDEPLKSLIKNKHKHAFQ